MSGREWLSVAEDGTVSLLLHVQPNARKTEFSGLHGDAMKIRLAAPPVDGKANAALCDFIARYCGVGRSAVTLVSGDASRSKRVRIEGLAGDKLEQLRAAVL